MGWAFGRSEHPRTRRPRDIGYGVRASCDQIGPKCKERIDRGLSYYCGDEGSVEGGGEWGCGGYFCGKHLSYFVCEGHTEIAGQFCGSCLALIEREHRDECDDCREEYETRDKRRAVTAEAEPS